MITTSAVCPARRARYAAAFCGWTFSRVAYSSVSHMGFIVLGMFALNGTGMDGSVIQMHGPTPAG